MPTIAPEAETVELPLDPDVRRAFGAARTRLCATDAHRLELQAKLTELGVPPGPGDRDALRQLAVLDTGSVDAVVRWLSHAAGLPHPGGETFRVTEPAPAAGTGTAPAPAPPASAVNRPAEHLDPRLIAW